MGPAPRPARDAGARPKTGGAVVLLVDPAQREAALRALAPHVQKERPDIDVLGAQIQPARWSFAELYDWSGVILIPTLREGVTTIDIDERENRIVFGVVDATARAQFERNFSQLDLPCFLVGIKIVGRIIKG